MDITEKMSMGASNAVVATMNAALKEEMSAPHMTYNFECVGPREECRAEYIQLRDQVEALLDEADEMEDVGLLEAADGLIRQAAEIQARMATMTEVKWSENVPNVVTNTGRNDVLDKYFKGSAYTAAWYLGLKGTGSAAAGDTLASHAGWSEVTPYSGSRKAITWGTTSSQSNTATAVSFSITGSATVAGGFITTASSGTSGTLYSASDFASSRTVANGDTLNVTPTVSD